MCSYIRSSSLSVPCVVCSGQDGENQGVPANGGVSLALSPAHHETNTHSCCFVIPF